MDDPRLKLRSQIVLRAIAAGRYLPALVLALGLTYFFAHPAAARLGPASSSDARSYYYCPSGLVQTGTDDPLANGSNCAYWLGKSFPLGGSSQPTLNQTAVPGLDVLPVWQRTQGDGVTVAVIDTGVDPASSDLAPNLVSGWNFYDGNANVSDTGGHGTLIASIIAAAAGNGDYLGIAPRAKILPVKIMGGSSGEDWSDAAAVAGVEYAIRSGAKVLNCSFGGLNATIPGMAQALSAAERAGVLVVIAAGNDGRNLDDPGVTESPDGYGHANTLTVANFTDRGALAGDSNYGARHVQIASLGDELWGDYPGRSTGGYVGGSSAATGTVSAVAALLFSAYPSATAEQVRRAIIVGANRGVAGLQGKVEANGLLSASGALAAMTTPDTHGPAAFRAVGRPFHFGLRGRRATELSFGWSRSTDPELEGYRLTLDGRVTVLPPTTTEVRERLAPGAHRWSVEAYDLSGNQTVASPAHARSST